MFVERFGHGVSKALGRFVTYIDDVRRPHHRRNGSLGAAEQRDRRGGSRVTGQLRELGEQWLRQMTDDRAVGSWRLTKGDREIFTKPRYTVMRSIMLNHWYHHRGQLSVYLRLLEVPVPVIYGRSADENPFA